MADTICNIRREKIDNDNHFRQTLKRKKNLFEAGDKIQVKNDAKAKKFQNPFAGISISQIPTLPFT